MMIIKNVTKNCVLSTEAIEARTFSQQTLGLLTHKNPIAMIFHTRFGIHTFFMKYPIDVLVLDKQNRVVAMKKNVKPYSIFLWKPSFNLVIELPEGKIDTTHTSLSDKINFQ